LAGLAMLPGEYNAWEKQIDRKQHPDKHQSLFKH